MKNSKNLKVGDWIIYNGNYFKVASFTYSEEYSGLFSILGTDIIDFPHNLLLHGNDFEILNAAPEDPKDEKDIGKGLPEI